jgi:AmiR/NasT family two-component response regulator
MFLPSWLNYLKEIWNSQIITVVSDQSTDEMNGKRPFEERVFARFDAVDSAISGLDSRVQKLEIRAYDTKPIWEQALKEIIETKREIVETRRELSKRLDRIDAIALETRADLRDAEDRLDKIEPKPVP